MVTAGIVGGTGYTGIELMRLLAFHPDVALHCVTSRSATGQAVAALFPSLRGVVELSYVPPDTPLLKECDVVFFAAANGTAMHAAPGLLQAGVKVIDLAADFRLSDTAKWQQCYGMTHACPELVAEAAYGIPEVNRERIRNARLVANSGCYPVATILGLTPLLEADVIAPTGLIADAKSGVSGSGRKAALVSQFCEVHGSFKAYSASAHRHHPEIVQQLNRVAKAPVELTFVPHLVPMVRGIHATLYARVTNPQADFQAIFEQRYGAEAFVDVMPPGSHPATGDVVGSNMCRLSWHRPLNSDHIVVLCVEDNLVKGAAGQAIQNMNLMLGLDETRALIGATTTSAAVI